jgi:predicted porin
MFRLFALLLLVSILVPSTPARAEPISVDGELLRQLQETLRQQQDQLRVQAEQIRSQAEQLQLMQQQIHALQQQQAPLSSPPVAAGTAPAPFTVSSGNDRIKLTLSGQLNRAVNVVSDGAGTDVYPVDNDASNSRIRFVGSAAINDDLTLGTRLELSVAPDESSRVSQKTQSSGDYFDQRWAEVSLASRTFGKLSIGKGDTASNTTAESDLSRTDVVQYAGVADIAGGMLFRESGEGELTTIRVADAFKSRDGLSRQSRFRYDTPRLFGFSLAGSLVTGQRSDLALFWCGEEFGFRGAGSVAIANPREKGSGLQYDGSLSILHSASGLNLTLSGGLLEKDAARDATNLYGKLGWIAAFTDLGQTAFGLDYTRSGNIPSAGDRGYSVGAAVVQSFSRYATELYLQYRLYALDRGNGPTVDDLNLGTLGVRVRF